MTKWHFNVKRPATILDASIILESDIKELGKFAGIGYSKAVAVFSKGFASYYAPQNEVDKQVKYLSRAPKKVRQILKAYPKVRGDLEKALTKFGNTDLSFEDFLTRPPLTSSLRFLLTVLSDRTPNS